LEEFKVSGSGGVHAGVCVPRTSVFFSPLEEFFVVAESTKFAKVVFEGDVKILNLEDVSTSAQRCKDDLWCTMVGRCKGKVRNEQVVAVRS
jgi:hypothetical protein